MNGRDWVWHWVCKAWATIRGFFHPRRESPPAPVPGHQATVQYVLKSLPSAESDRLIATGFLDPLAKAAELGAVIETTIQESPPGAGRKRFHEFRIEPRPRRFS